MEQPNLAKGELPTCLYSFNKGEQPHFLCSECNAPVFLVEHIVYKPCGHKDAAVLANLEATLRGTSAVS